MASNRQAWYAANHTELVANTPAAIGPGPGVHIARVIVTATITGNLAIYDGTSTSGALVYFEATPAAGVVREIGLRMKSGCWVVPGTAGTCSVIWD